VGFNTAIVDPLNAICVTILSDERQLPLCAWQMLSPENLGEVCL
jgi:hypothetical protein